MKKLIALFCVCGALARAQTNYTPVIFNLTPFAPTVWHTTCYLTPLVNPQIAGGSIVSGGAISFAIAAGTNIQESIWPGPYTMAFAGVNNNWTLNVPATTNVVNAADCISNVPAYNPLSVPSLVLLGVNMTNYVDAATNNLGNLVAVNMTNYVATLGNSIAVKMTNAANIFAGNGARLTNIAATNVTGQTFGNTINVEVYSTYPRQGQGIGIGQIFPYFGPAFSPYWGCNLPLSFVYGYTNFIISQSIYSTNFFNLDNGINFYLYYTNGTRINLGNEKLFNGGNGTTNFFSYSYTFSISPVVWNNNTNYLSAELFVWTGGGASPTNVWWGGTASITRF